MIMYLLIIYFGYIPPPQVFCCLFECIILSYIRPFLCNYNICILNIFLPYPSTHLFLTPLVLFVHITHH